jgi:heat shock protein HtpX
VSDYQISWIAILVLIFAPLLTVFLQLALSRTREFDEDLGAVALTGDPQGLASALSKMERYKGGVLSRIFLPGHREPHPPILRAHPQTEERIKRLLSLSKQKPEFYHSRTSWRKMFLIFPNTGFKSEINPDGESV